ncbi:hypothetical protein DFR67_109160 [Williamsia limnetica]|jgi:hypothetical protein|uniref:Uncharacterized protein n=1 Tax=Williamsia limnetica TaxID=882452 RepID=A0A318RGE9_WILLI|nr:hypothetical protein DFR67_109160 [Williamsia limnetica]
MLETIFYFFEVIENTFWVIADAVATGSVG